MAEPGQILSVSLRFGTGSPRRSQAIRALAQANRGVALVAWRRNACDPCPKPRSSASSKSDPPLHLVRGGLSRPQRRGASSRPARRARRHAHEYRLREHHASLGGNAQRRDGNAGGPDRSVAHRRSVPAELFHARRDAGRLCRPVPPVGQPSVSRRVGRGRHRRRGHRDKHAPCKSEGRRGGAATSPWRSAQEPSRCRRLQPCL